MKEHSGVQGNIFDIKRFSMHDGCGIRTLVFMKGCPLRCKWCENPESQEYRNQIWFNENLCIDCGECRKICPSKANLQNKLYYEEDVCTKCALCVMSCYSNARKLVSRMYTIDEIIRLIMRDDTFYENSGGGVTIGGGEPTAQVQFVTTLLKELGRHKIHTAIETCGFCTWKCLRSVVEHCDLLLYDIKHIDSAKHIEGTHVGNEVILENAIKASKIVKDMIIRYPLILNYNSGEGELHELARFVSSRLRNVSKINILPYHEMGRPKYAYLCRQYRMRNNSQPDEDVLLRTVNILKGYGLEISIIR